MKSAVFAFLMCVSQLLAAPSQQLLAGMRTVESRNNAEAYNRKEHAVGLYQIRPDALTDINKRYKTKYTLADFYRLPRLGAWAVHAYGNIYGARTDEHYARIWNGGPSGMRKAATAGYWKRVKGAMR